MIIAVDFDGTLMNPNDRGEGKKMGRPFPGAVEAMRHLHLLGHILIVHTFQGDQPHIREWLRYFGIPNDGVTNIKPNADVFVDDRAIHFDGDWNHTMTLLRKLA